MENVIGLLKDLHQSVYEAFFPFPKPAVVLVQLVAEYQSENLHDGFGTLFGFPPSTLPIEPTEPRSPSVRP